MRPERGPFRTVRPAFPYRQTIRLRHTCMEAMKVISLIVIGAVVLLALCASAIA
jgi:hypothetical protein